MFQHKALEAPLDRYLGDFSLYLWQQGIAHRIYEQSGNQVVWVEKESAVEPVNLAYKMLVSGDLKLFREKKETEARPLAKAKLLALFSRSKATVILILLSFLGALLVHLDPHGSLIHFVTFQDFAVEKGALVFVSAQESFASGESWRLLTPVFLHFGALHIVFNSLWLWELGRRVEFNQGIFRLLALVFLIGVGSNIIQYLVYPDTVFGGMSGVIYGLLGYCWLWDKLSPDETFKLPPGIVGFMLVWLVIGYSGVFTLVGVNIANAAHLAGLIIGVITGAGGALIASRKPAS